MLKATIDNGKVMVMASGSSLDITHDVCLVIDAIYKRLEDDSEKNSNREAFRKALVHILTDPDSPLFVMTDDEEEGEA